MYDMIEFEDDFEHTGSVIGVDECNFSPSIAGTIGASACWMPEEPIVGGVNDSKQLTDSKLKLLFERIQETGIYSFTPGLVNGISNFGVYQERNMAFKSAVFSLMEKLDREGEDVSLIIVDGGDTPIDDIKQMLSSRQDPPRVIAMSSADEKSYNTAAASIIAKVLNDCIFSGAEDIFGGGEYGLDSNHGAMSEKHRRALNESGPTAIHRDKNYAKEWWDKILDEG